MAFWDCYMPRTSLEAFGAATNGPRMLCQCSSNVFHNSPKCAPRKYETPNAGLMLVERLRRWPNIGPAPDEGLVSFSGTGLSTNPLPHQQTWGIHPLLDQCWASVVDTGPALIQQWVGHYIGSPWATLLSCQNLLNIWTTVNHCFWSRKNYDKRCYYGRDFIKGTTKVSGGVANKPHSIKSETQK